MDFESQVLFLLTEIKELLEVATSRTDEDEKIKDELQKLRELELANKIETEQMQSVLIQKEKEALNEK